MTLAPRLPLDREPNTPPVWCSMCGSVLTQANVLTHAGQDGIMPCECERCRKVLEARVRRIMGASVRIP